MSSDKQTAANRANAQKSTGPTTAQGKAKASRNALKHGLSGDGEVLPLEDEALYADRLQQWLNAAQPDDEIERYQIATAAWATVKLDRCARKDLAETNRRRAHAKGRWEASQTRKVHGIVEFWTAQPDACVAQLET